VENKGNEQLLAELEHIAQQLRTAKQETSAAVAGDLLYGLSGHGFEAGRVKSGKVRGVKQWLRKRGKQVAVVALTAVVLFGGGWAMSVMQQRPSTETIVTGVRDLATLATAEAEVMTTLEGRDNKILGMDIALDIPGTQRAYFIVVPAKIQAGVDLKNVSDQDVRVDQGTKKVELTLPHATFTEEAVQTDKVKVFTNEGLFRSPTTAKEGFQFVSQAQVLDKLKQDAQADGILQRAEDNAVKALQGFYGKLGYQVTVKFK
jgi:hypothetical protein